MPKKIQFAPSQAKWVVQSCQSVLLILGLDALKQQMEQHENEFSIHLKQLIAKAKALDIPIIELSNHELILGMQQLGEHLSTRSQLIVAGKITAQFKQILPHLHSVTTQICVIDDAISLPNQEQHIQWIDSLTAQALHHMNSYSIKRLWSLSAPSAYILSSKGILLSIAEQLHMDALEIDPHTDLYDYGLDSVAMVSLVGLWRANGATIRYEDMQSPCSVYHLLALLAATDHEQQAN